MDQSHAPPSSIPRRLAKACYPDPGLSSPSLLCAAVCTLLSHQRACSSPTAEGQGVQVSTWRSTRTSRTSSELPPIVPRKHTEKYDVEKKEKRAEALMAEAAELLGMSPDEPPEPGQSGGPRLLRDPTVALDFMVECEAVEVAAAPAGAAAAVPTVDFAYAIDTAHMVHMEHVHMYGM